MSDPTLAFYRLQMMPIDPNRFTAVSTLMDMINPER